jgi:hypothetical protein
MEDESYDIIKNKFKTLGNPWFNDYGIDLVIELFWNNWWKCCWNIGWIYICTSKICNRNKSKYEKMFVGNVAKGVWKKIKNAANIEVIKYRLRLIPLYIPIVRRKCFCFTFLVDIKMSCIFYFYRWLYW